MIHESSYFPLQPEIQKTTNDYQEIKWLNNGYDRNIALFYQFETNRESVNLLSLIPDGCFDILVCCSSNYPYAILWTSPLHRRKQPNFRVNCTYFGVRFYPEQSLLRVSYPMKELLDQQVPLLDVLPMGQSFVEQIGMAKSFKDRIKFFLHYLDIIKENLNSEQKIVRYSVDKIYLSSGNLNIQELSRVIGYTPQYIRKKFEKYIGFSPKQFCRIVKFQNALDEITLINEKKMNLTEITTDNGFYDQSHFIREFKKLANLTPKQYIEYLID
ncbi:AraC family transcriptional regulator [Sporolactobacillus sp. THM7-4]|nr:AraC family transcriptional regulator [Sporolactobacillus sp. THM7-4]